MGTAELKILYHHRTTARDGSAVHIDGLVCALRQLGAEVIMAAPEPVATAVQAERYLRLQALRRRMPRWLHEMAEMALNLPEAFRLARAVRRHRPALIYQRSNLYLLSGLWVSRLMGVPVVTEVNAPYFFERSRYGGISWPALAEWTERAVWRNADATITVTGVLAEMVMAAGTRPERVHVMPNGVDPQRFGLEAVDPAAKSRLGLDSWTVLGFTGYVRDWNGLDPVLELLATPVGQSCFLLIVGDGPARARLEARAAALGVESRLRFTGVLPRSQIAAHVSSFDIALQPAANPYASPLKLFEYMALGRAIIAPDQPNIREILSDGRDALLFLRGAGESLRSAIARLVADPALRTRLSKGAVDTVHTRELTWLCNAKRVMELANRLSGGEGSTSVHRNGFDAA